MHLTIAAGQVSKLPGQRKPRLNCLFGFYQDLLPVSPSSSQKELNMKNAVSVDPKKLLGFKLQPNDAQGQQVAKGAKIGKPITGKNTVTGAKIGKPPAIGAKIGKPPVIGAKVGKVGN